MFFRAKIWKNPNKGLSLQNLWTWKSYWRKKLAGTAVFFFASLSTTTLVSFFISSNYYCTSPEIWGNGAVEHLGHIMNLRYLFFFTNSNSTCKIFNQLRLYLGILTLSFRYGIRLDFVFNWYEVKLRIILERSQSLRRSSFGRKLNVQKGFFHFRFANYSKAIFKNNARSGKVQIIDGDTFSRKT